MVLTFDTSTAGAKVGAIGVLLASNGAGTSGLGLLGLPTQNLSVTGMVTTSSSLVEIVTIKYAPLENIRVLPNRAVQLQFFSAPGTVCRFQATTNFPNWSNIGTATAGADGVVRLEDSNASAHPSRFYRMVAP